MTASVEAAEFAIPDDTSTGETIAVGGSLTGRLDYAGDEDWYRIELVAGQAVQIDLAGTGPDALEDPLVRLFDDQGRLLASNDDGGPGLNSRLIFTPSETGTYYIEADSYASSLSSRRDGDYRLDVAAVAPPKLSDAVQGATRLDTSDPITVYFSEAGDQYNYNGTTYTASGLNAYEEAQLWSIFEGVEAFADIEFELTTNRSAADLEWATAPMSGGLLGFFYFPSTLGTGGYGVLNNSFSGWSDAPGGGMDQGGFMYGVSIHELGHGLGLGHTHDSGNGTQILSGVSSSASLGDHDLNQAIFSQMSYNDGWETNPDGTPGTYDYGYMGTFGAVDIAALQAMYGANESFATGDDSYALDARNQSGTGYAAIWDTGGSDEISYVGGRDAVIDLRAATLKYEEGGGGFVSHVRGVFGGFTIAHGVVIERATSSAGDDILTGNAAANVLDAGSGNDTLSGGDGADILDGGDGDDILMGGEGDDVFEGGAGVDRLTGDAGGDVFVFSADISNAGDVITDYAAEDLIVFENAAIAPKITIDGANVLIEGLVLSGAADVQVSVLSYQGSSAFSNANEANVNVPDLSGIETGNAAALPVGPAKLVQYDLGDVEYWAQDLRVFTEDGEDYRVLTKDDASTVTTNYDQANSNGWSLITTDRDSAGQVTREATLLDAGSQFVTFHDTETTLPWVSSTSGYDDQGRADYNDITYDNGTRIFTDMDQADVMPWVTKLTTRNADGDITSVRNDYDSGLFEVVYGDYTGLEAWTQKIDSYDADRRRDYVNFYMDDGARRTEDFDQADTLDFSVTEIRYNASGAATSQNTVYDDGTRILKSFDADGTEAWVELIVSYDALGQADTMIRHLDDGSRVETNYDQDDAFTWARHIREFDADNDLTAEYFV